jgi:cytochrome c1
VKIVAGYENLMPPFTQASEDDLIDLIAYIRSLQAPQAGGER